mmetsp:Transcript_7921/g.23839  ORF Transcript_7921/g.23839 Transcript_7921/m.23839 type:complete len:210 (-) Transcript_7921:126-755(-)
MLDLFVFRISTQDGTIKYQRKRTLAFDFNCKQCLVLRTLQVISSLGPTVPRCGNETPMHSSLLRNRNSLVSEFLSNRALTTTNGNVAHGTCLAQSLTSSLRTFTSSRFGRGARSRSCAMPWERLVALWRGRGCLCRRFIGDGEGAALAAAGLGLQLAGAVGVGRWQGLCHSGGGLQQPCYRRRRARENEGRTRRRVARLAVRVEGPGGG